VLAVLRDPCFSLNAVEKDKAVMMAVAKRLTAAGHAVEVVSETDISSCRPAAYDLILSMGRHAETLRLLQSSGCRVINSSEGVSRCRRSQLQQTMKEAGVPMPPEQGPQGYWLKRGDAAGALTKEDVVFAADEKALQRRIAEFRQRGIDDYVVSAHVTGDEIKFYGVRGTGFFRCYDPNGDGESFQVAAIQQAAERLAAAVGIDVYGGDCIIRQDGTFCMIDFNDWPSFSRCREEAADAIVSYITEHEEI